MVPLPSESKRSKASLISSISSSVLDEDVLDLLLALLVHVLLVVGDQRLGESLPDGVDLGGVTTALHTDADINISKPVLSKKKNWLHELELETSGLNQLQRASINLDEALSPLAVSHGGGGLLATKGLDRLYGLLLVSHSSFSCRSESSNISLVVLDAWRRPRRW